MQNRSSRPDEHAYPNNCIWSNGSDGIQLATQYAMNDATPSGDTMVNQISYSFDGILVSDGNAGSRKHKEKWSNQDL